MRKFKRLLCIIVGIMIVCYIGSRLDSKKVDTEEKSQEGVKKVTEAANEVQTYATDVLSELAGVAYPESKSSDDSTPKNTQKGDVSVIFVDVGQGDCIIIHDGDDTMMIDTGAYEGYDNIQAVLDELNEDVVDVLVLTHPDADHIQNAADIIADYNVGSVIMPDIENDTKTYDNTMSAIKTYGCDVYNPCAGSYIGFGSASYQIVGPITYDSDTNSCSIIIRMVNGNDSFLFTGDATGDETDEILASGLDLSCDVYKASHHGSANDGCNNTALLRAADPAAMVVSCGYKNSHGHPHIETMEYAKENGISLYRTDLQGTIIFETSGDGISSNIEPTTVYTNGNEL